MVCILFLCLSFAMVLAGCHEFYSEHSYFGGAVYVEYRQGFKDRETDSLMVRFNEPGLYAVAFLKVESHKTTVEMPKSFIKKVEEVPVEVTFNQKMPGWVKVIIVTGGGNIESHDFH